MSDIAMMRRALAKQSRLRLFDTDICVLHAGAMDYVVGMNPSSAMLMDALERFPNSEDDVLAAYAKALGVEEEVAREFIAMQVEAWSELNGVFDPVVQIDAPCPKDVTPLFKTTIAFGGHPVALVIYDQIMVDLIAPVIVGLKVDAAPVETVLVWRRDETLFISRDTGPIHHTQDPLLARGEVLTALVEAAFPDALGHPHIHGATLAAPSGKQVLITGDSGQGKTTLALGLGAHGFDLLADDFSIFMPETQALVPVFFNPSVKQGAWPVLAPLYPSLAEITPVDQGPRQCKYLPRKTAPKAAFSGARADLIVFPKWNPTETPSLTPYDKGEAILSLLRHSHLPQNQSNLQAMLDYLAGSDIWQVTYSEFSEAKDLIVEALA